MCIPRTFAILTLAGGLYCGTVPAQTTTNAPLFRVSFSATCQSFNPATGRVVTTRITDRNIVAQATGVSAATRNFALVFNPAEDSLQVADASGQPIMDVVHFGGGAAIADAHQLVRLTFMFFPGQTNEVGAETNVFGTALITERASHTTSSGTVTRANITGKLQFTLTSGTPLGTTNIIEGSTNVEICVGTFTTGGQFPSTTTGAGVAGGTTGTTGTNGVSGTTGTNGVTTTGTNTTTTTPVVIVTTPGTTFIPNTTGTTTTTFGATTGLLPSLTGNGALPGLGTTVGTGTVSLTPFNTLTPVGIGTPINTVTVGTPILGTTTVGTTSVITPAVPVSTTTTVSPVGVTTTAVTPVTTTTGIGTTTGTTTGTLTPSGSLAGF